MDIMRMTKLVLIIIQGSIFPSQIQTTSTTIKAVWHFFWATQFSVQFKPCHAVHTVWLKVTVLGVNVALNLLLIMYPIYLDLRSVLNSWFFLEQMDVKKLHLRIQNELWNRISNQTNFIYCSCNCLGDIFQYIFCTLQLLLTVLDWAIKYGHTWTTNFGEFQVLQRQTYHWTVQPFHSYHWSQWMWFVHLCWFCNDYCNCLTVSLFYIKSGKTLNRKMNTYTCKPGFM